ncbi:hypothetical protein NMG60_11014430 [Bertholletia excelsa]
MNIPTCIVYTDVLTHKRTFEPGTEVVFAPFSLFSTLKGVGFLIGGRTDGVGFRALAMALDDPTGSRSPQSSVVVALNRYIENLIHSVKYKGESSSVPWVTATKYRTMMARLPRNSVLCEFQRQEFEAESASTGEEAPNWRQLIRVSSFSLCNS